MGWQPDLPDGRDFTFRHPNILPLLQRLQPVLEAIVPEQVDLRRDGDGKYFTDIDDQGSLHASAAFAVLSMVEYFERRVLGHTYNGSALFLYQVTRHRIAKRMHPLWDAGADIRTTLKVLTQVGVPPEEYWPYDTEHFGLDPNPFVHSLAKPPVGHRYFRISELGNDGDCNWNNVRSFLAAGFPLVFGFSVPQSLSIDPDIPFRPDFDSIHGGQCAVAVGYQLNRYGPRQDALLIRSSWGSEWGDHGNGWLPVSFLRHHLARDFWTIIDEDWLASTELTCPSIAQSNQWEAKSENRSASFP